VKTNLEGIISIKYNSVLVLAVFVMLLLSSCAQNRMIYVFNDPPKMMMEERPVKPHQKSIWIEGHWKWQDWAQKYIWVPGEWRKPKRGRVYISGSWEKTQRGWLWLEGYWK